MAVSKPARRPESGAPRATVTVHAHALLASHRVRLIVGQAHVERRPEGPEICILLGAFPTEPRLYISLRDVLRLMPHGALVEQDEGLDSAAVH